MYRKMKSLQGEKKKNDPVPKSKDSFLEYDITFKVKKIDKNQ